MDNRGFSIPIKMVQHLKRVVEPIPILSIKNDFGGIKNEQRAIN